MRAGICARLWPARRPTRSCTARSRGSRRRTPSSMTGSTPPRWRRRSRTGCAPSRSPPTTPGCTSRSRGSRTRCPGSASPPRARQAAAAELEPAVAAEPANPELQRALGEALARAGDPAALDHLRLALAASERPSGAVARGPFAARDPGLDAWIRRRAGHDLADTSRYRRALARYLLERGLWDQAAAAWERLAADAPGDADARYGLGVALEGLGAFDRALEALRAAVAQAPGVVRYREGLAERLWASEQYHQAINEWRTVRDQAPRNVTARLSLARAYEKIGEPADAYREYRAVLEIDPGNADAARALSKFK